MGTLSDLPKDENRVVILTAIPAEFRAVSAHFDANQRVRISHPQGTIYESYPFSGNVRVVMAEIGEGNEQAAVEAERAISYFEPKLLLFVGVAGGVKDVELGDVVAAKRITTYDSGKESTSEDGIEELFFRETGGWSDYSMEQLARAISRDRTWKNRILNRDQNTAEPKAFISTIAAGPRVIGSSKGHTKSLLKRFCGDAVAVEMEGAGVFRALRMNAGVKFLVIRGISDLLDKKERTDNEGWQVTAATNASAFAIEVIARNFHVETVGAAGTNKILDKSRLGTLLNSIASGSITLSVAFLQAKTLLYQIADQPDKDWIDFELEGYEILFKDKPTYPPANFPLYRFPAGTLFANQGLTPIAFDEGCMERSNGTSMSIFEKFTRRPIVISIEQIESLLNSRDTNISMSLAADADAVLRDSLLKSFEKKFGRDIAGLILSPTVDISIVYDRTAFIGILGSARNKLIEVLLKHVDPGKTAVKIDAEAGPAKDESVEKILHKFRTLPGAVSGSEIRLCVKIIGEPATVSKSQCFALGIVHGSSLKRKIELIELPAACSFLSEIYANEDCSDWLFELPIGAIVEVQVILTFAEEEYDYIPEQEVMRFATGMTRYLPEPEKRSRELKVMILTRNGRVLD